MQTHIHHSEHHHTRHHDGEESYVQCGRKLCHGASAHCCTWAEDECCFLSWYTVWWIWVAAILLIVVIFAMLICCFRNRRVSHHSARHMVVVHAPPNRCIYGSFPDHHHCVSYKVTAPPMPPPYTEIPEQHKV